MEGLILKKKNGLGFEISPSIIGKRDEKKFQTLAMWSAQAMRICAMYWKINLQELSHCWTNTICAFSICSSS